jgi:hypothetical protein
VSIVSRIIAIGGDSGPGDLKCWNNIPAAKAAVTNNPIAKLRRNIPHLASKNRAPPLA